METIVQIFQGLLMGLFVLAMLGLLGSSFWVLSVPRDRRDPFRFYRLLPRRVQRVYKYSLIAVFAIPLLLLFGSFLLRFFASH